ncbi:MAG TPA: hypothetical protein VGL41_12690 [Roseiarcus sp.]|jgi:hypothetical protein
MSISNRVEFVELMFGAMRRRADHKHKIGLASHRIDMAPKWSAAACSRCTVDRSRQFTLGARAKP